MSSDKKSTKLEGVFSDGYGVVPKAVMLDERLTAEAKVLYAYYCVISSNKGGWQSAPNETTILNALHISHARYSRHRSLLKELELIVFTQGKKTAKNGRMLFEGMEFVINKAPSAGKFSEQNTLNDYPLTRFAARQQGIYEKGYGIVPRKVVFDNALSIEAKAVYVFLCVHAAASLNDTRSADVAFAYISNKLISKKRAQGAVSELISAGYISRVRTNSGRFGGFTYLLLFDNTGNNSNAEVDFDTTENETAKSNTALINCENAQYIRHFKQNVSNIDTAFSCPGVDFDTAENSTAKHTQVGFDTTKNDTPKNKTAENDTATIYNNKQKNNKNNNIKINNIISSSESDTHEPTPESEMMRTNIPAMPCLANTTNIASKKTQRGTLRERIDRVEKQLQADILREQFDDAAVDAIVMLMASVTPDSENISISGRSIPAEDVCYIFGRLKFCHIEYVLQQLKNCGEISNARAYLLTCLYNAPVNYGAFFASFNPSRR